MAANLHMPPQGFGPGSQPDEGEELDWLPLPSGMRTYDMHLPEVVDPAPLAPAFNLLTALADACDAVAGGAARRGFDLSGLDAENRALIAETLGQGEVSLRARGVPAIAAQESVFAGVWVLKAEGIDRVEVAPIPAVALERAFVPQRPAIGVLAPRQPGVVNAPALLAELIDKSAAWRIRDDLHVVNLTLLPHTEEDLVWIDAALGQGSVTILSRGYGNCRLTATGQAHVWRVQFFNSMDTLILDTFEVTDVPEVALAAPEDLADSADRIREVLGAIR